MDMGHGQAAASSERTYLPKHRILALTDGVVAIAMTLLVLDIDVPDGLRGQALRDALDDVQSQVGTFLLSAVVIALFWRAHHSVLHDAERIDGSLFWCNVAFLALVSLIPFPTRVLADYGHQPLGPGLYGAVIGTTALVLYVMAVRIALGSERRKPFPPFPAQAFVFLLSVGIAQFSPLTAVYSWIASVPLSVLADRHATRTSRASRP
ncbi:TMEM175 family protein [Streptomyces sp. NPDC053367]|uniref:TMEM175 family protein n=1 Tax=Streptomyces sp. NPDC053367 TaxID=3365700 RepID=UPI0037D359C7